MIHANADIRFRHIELSRLMQATHTFKGAGIIGGQARIDTNGNSLASMMGQGNGELKLVLVSAGDVSALLVDIAGLEFGNALLSAIGVPQRAQHRLLRGGPAADERRRQHQGAVAGHRTRPGWSAAARSTCATRRWTTP